MSSTDCTHFGASYVREKVNTFGPGTVSSKRFTGGLEITGGMDVAGDWVSFGGRSRSFISEINRGSQFSSVGEAVCFNSNRIFVTLGVVSPNFDILVRFALAPQNMI